jgi:hypothetical protein
MCIVNGKAIWWTTDSKKRQDFCCYIWYDESILKEELYLEPEPDGKEV